MTSPLRTRVDLHAHTTWSDGVLGATALCDAMASAGLDLVALSDHDTLHGYRELRAARRTEARPRVIPGVEINAVTREHPLFRGSEIHILGYGVDPEDATFEAFLSATRASRRERAERMVTRLRGSGSRIDHAFLQALPEGAAVGRPVVAAELVRLGEVRDVGTAMGSVLARGGAGYVPRDGVSPEEAIQRIRGAGGLAVLAHFPDLPRAPDFRDALMRAGLDGIEVHYGGRVRPFSAEAVRAMSALATDHGLLATGGTDYHGHGMSYAQAISTTHVPSSVGDALLEALATRAGRATPATDLGAPGAARSAADPG